MIIYSKDGITVRDSELSDIAEMKDRLRPLEISEVWASHHMNPEQALETSYRSSTGRLTFVYNDEIIGMFGVVPDSLLADKAMVWLLTTEAIEKMKYSFLKLSRKFICLIMGRYGTLYNYVDARNIKCVNWLKWCGAIVSPHETYGLDQMPFHYFTFGGQ